MNFKKWTKIWFYGFISVNLAIGLFNYIIDPYGIYNVFYFDFPKIEQEKRLRLFKSIKVKEAQYEYKSIILGTSRADIAYNPNHKYFIKPSYNFSISAGSLYESGLFFSEILKRNKLKQALLVADYRAFNDKKQKEIQEIETYFSKNTFLYLVSADTLMSAIKTVLGCLKPTKSYFVYNENTGQRKNINFTTKYRGGYLRIFKKDESTYYKDSSTNYTYKDTGNNSFEDFDKILKVCYEKNIRLDIVFGPSHIRQWEALNYYLGYEKWLQWKKDVVLEVENISKIYKKTPFKVYDFATYNKFTAEKIPTKKGVEMKWHYDNNHYRDTLGEKVLNVLAGSEKYDNFGIELNTSNIDEHLDNQRKNREKYIDTKKYKEEFEEYLENQ